MSPAVRKVLVEVAKAVLLGVASAIGTELGEHLAKRINPPPKEPTK